MTYPHRMLDLYPYPWLNPIAYTAIYIYIANNMIWVCLKLGIPTWGTWVYGLPPKGKPSMSITV